MISHTANSSDEFNVDDFASHLRDVILNNTFDFKIFNLDKWHQFNTIIKKTRNTKLCIDLLKLCHSKNQFHILEFLLEKWKWLCEGEVPIVLYIYEKKELIIICSDNEQKTMFGSTKSKSKSLDYAFVASVNIGANNKVQLVVNGDLSDIKFLGGIASSEYSVFKLLESNICRVSAVFKFEVFEETRLIFRIERNGEKFKLNVIVNPLFGCIITDMITVTSETDRIPIWIVRCSVWKARKVGNNQQVKIEEVFDDMQVKFNSEYLISAFIAKRQFYFEKHNINTATTINEDSLFHDIEMAKQDHVKHYLITEKPISTLEDEISIDDDWILQLFSGVKYLHDRNYIHMNLEPSKVAIFQKDIVKISDHWKAVPEGSLYFGSVGIFTDPLFEFYCTKMNDIYSLGMTLLWVITGGFESPPSNFENFIREKRKICNNKLKEMVLDMLNVNSKKRPNIDECIQIVKDIIANRPPFKKIPSSQLSDCTIILESSLL